ncbi:Lactonase, 7-bladed beta-propeller-domain-containing protein [Tricladium varicosporioides]|nr:Lactonase, 7-bladed beta-propeller-domain-containing protein [Hymenoscyphus varicosporioides]
MMGYILSEIAVSLTVFKIWVDKSGEGLQWEMVQEVDMRVGFGGRYRGGVVLASEIALTENNKFLMTSLRNDSSFSIPSPTNPSSNQTISSDSLLTYSISPSTGLIDLVDEVAAGGSYPRQFSLNKGGDLVAVAEQYDGNVVILGRDVHTGNVEGVVAAMGNMGSGRLEGVVQVVWWE